MSENEASEVDRAAAEAWTRFQARLGDRLAELAEGDVLVIEAMVGDDSEPGARPHVQFAAWGDAMLRGEAASNHVLMAPRRLEGEQERALLALGYDAPTHTPDDPPDLGSLDFHVDLPQAEADRLAVMSVRALRDVYGVEHPALLSGDVVEDLSAPEEPAAVERTEEPVAAYPHGHEELSELVDRALTPYFGHEPRRDDDGDIPVDLGSTVLFVRVHESVPVVELFACAASDVQDLERAAFEINVLNRDVRFVKFRLVGDSILADLQIPAWPFAPEHLRAMLAHMTETIERIGADLVERVGGRHLLGDDEADPDPDEADEDEAEDDESRAPWRSAECILAQLDAGSPGSVSPELAASICGYDVELILGLIGNAEAQEVAWRAARDSARTAGDAGDVVVCKAEMTYSRDSVRLLRRALRVVVERQALRAEAQHWAPVIQRSPRRRPLPPRPRRVPDPTLEEVDPEIWG